MMVRTVHVPLLRKRRFWVRVRQTQKGRSPVVGPRPSVPLRAVLAYGCAFWQCPSAFECASARAPVDSPGLFSEKGGFAPCGCWWTKAGWPTACEFGGAHSSPGTKTSLTARAGKLTVPTSSAETKTAATSLFTLLNMLSFRVAFRSCECLRISGLDGSSLTKKPGSKEQVGSIRCPD